MAISTNCPNCKALFRLGDEMSGQQVKCQKCATIFTVPKAAEGTTVPGTKAGAAALNLEIDDAPPPKASPSSSGIASAPKPAPAPKADAIEPAAKGSVKPPPVKKRRDLDEDDEADDDRPPSKARRKPAAQSGGGSGMLIAILLLVGVGLFSCVGCAGFGFFWLRSAREVVKVAEANAAAQDARPDLNGKKADADGPQPNPLPAGAIAVVFNANGIYVSNNNLVATDPFNRFNRRHKAYQVQLDANQDYVVEMKSVPMDCHLYLCDDKGAVVAENDDANFNLDSQIHYRAPRTGTYRIEAATHRFNETGPYTLIVRRVGAPKPIPKIEPPTKVNPPPPANKLGSLVTRVTKTGGFVFTALKMRPATNLAMADPCWDAGAKNLYYLEGSSVNRADREFRLQATRNLDRAHLHFALSSEGPLVSTVAGEVLVLDGQTLAVRAKLPAAGVRGLVAAPGSPFALVWTIQLAVVDVKTGTILPTQLQGAPANFANFRSLALSPDGKYLFAQGSDSTLHRARVEGTRIIHEASKPAPANATASFAISPDSKHVAICFPSIVKSFASKIATTSVYSMENWNTPAYTLPARLKMIAFAENGALFAYPDKAGLRFYPNPARNDVNYLTWTPSSPVRRIVASPVGNGCLEITLTGTTWVEPGGKK